MWHKLECWNITESDSKIYEGVLSNYFESDVDGRWVIPKKFRNLKFRVKETHDGHDESGPESHIYDLWVSWKDKNSREHDDLWHREFWYNGEDNEPFVQEDPDCFYLKKIKQDHMKQNEKLYGY